MLDLFYIKQGVEASWQAFRSQGYPDADLLSSEHAHYQLMAGLPPILRTLLITDGTVTRSLEAYFWEPVKIHQKEVARATAADSIPWLNSIEGENVLIREVELIGQTSETTYTTAYSIIRLDKVPSNMRYKLESGGIGIGVLISQFGVESYRELLTVGYTENMTFNDQEIGSNKGQGIIYRTYRIMIDKEPIILITEKFPICIYE